jgi:hypothetical protein
MMDDAKAKDSVHKKNVRDDGTIVTYNENFYTGRYVRLEFIGSRKLEKDDSCTLWIPGVVG